MAGRKSRAAFMILMVLALVLLAFAIGRGLERRQQEEDTRSTPSVTSSDPGVVPSPGSVPSNDESVLPGGQTQTTQLAPAQEPPAAGPPPQEVPEPQVGPLPAPGPDPVQ